MADPVRGQDVATSNLTEMVGRILAANTFSCWEAFASTIYGDRKPYSEHKNAEFLSLEGVHNIMHVRRSAVGFKFDFVLTEILPSSLLAARSSTAKRRKQTQMTKKTGVLGFEDWVSVT